MFVIVGEMKGKIKHPTFKVRSKRSQMSPSVVGDLMMASKSVMTDGACDSESICTGALGVFAEAYLNSSVCCLGERNLQIVGRN